MNRNVLEAMERKKIEISPDSSWADIVAIHQKEFKSDGDDGVLMACSDDSHTLALAFLAEHDDPEMDGTYAAHPAWWRGNRRGVQAACEVLNKVLDGKDDGAGSMGGNELEALRRRLLAMKGKS